MPNHDPKFFDIFIIAAATVFAMLGGVVKYLSDATEKQETVSWIGMLIQSVIGGFSGGVATFLMLHQDYNPYMILSGAGLAGFLGVIALRFFSRVVYRIVQTEENKK